MKKRIMGIALSVTMLMGSFNCVYADDLAPVETEQEVVAETVADEVSDDVSEESETTDEQETVQEEVQEETTLEDTQASTVEEEVLEETTEEKSVEVGEYNFDIAELSVGVVDGGKCGDSATYTIDDNGLLVITGSGDMWDEYDVNSKYSPFYYKRNLINKIAIADGITSIGNAIFYGCSNVTTVTMPESIKSVGDYAFSNCTKLTDVEIPKERYNNMELRF